MYDGDFEVMTLSEVAAYLKLGERTLLKMANNDEIPALKIANQWRFIKPVINDWLISRMNVLPQNDLSRAIEQEGDYLPVSRIIREEFTLLDLAPGKKEDILMQLINPLVNRDILKYSEQFLKQLLARENILSTGLGKGIAIPHIRNLDDNPEGGPYIVTGICRDGVNYDSLDNRPTHLFFLLVTDSEVLHIRTMSQLSKIFMDEEVSREIIGAKTFAQLLKTIMAKEHKLNYAG